MYTYEEVEKATLEYFNDNELATNVWITKYALRDSDGNLLEKTPDDMHRRLAKEFARIEKNKFKNPYNEDEIYEFFKNFASIIPQGSVLYGAGNSKHVSLSNCFVIETCDSIGGILNTDQEIAQISKRRGGVGYDISSLRPNGSLVSNSARTTSGAISFMHRFSHTGEEIGSNGRRAAQMISISVHHPDIEEFIKVKNDTTSVTGANISVRLSDEFLKAVQDDEEYEQRWPLDSEIPEISRMVSAKKIWNMIVGAAWGHAEPGILFWDNIINESPADCYEEFHTTSTNPCSEIPLSPYDSCRLLAINLFSCVDNPFTKDAVINYDRLYQTAYIAQRLMDDIVDLEIEKVKEIIKKVENDPEPTEIKNTELLLWKKILKAAQHGRRTGTGITAMGDTLAAANIKYNNGIEEVDKILKIFKHGCYQSSVDMARELGAFECWDYNKEKDNPFLLRIKDEDEKLYKDMKKYGRRNIACLTIAPTGSISLLTKIGDYFGTSSGIEPVFQLSYKRRKKINPNDDGAKTDFIDEKGVKWHEFEVYHNGYRMFNDFNPDRITCPYDNSCANDIDWKKRVELQAAAQKHICHAISSTINLPKDISKSEVDNIYKTAWKSGCKGMTVYRDGCRSGVLISSEEQTKDRPKELPCDVHHVTVKGQQYFVLVGIIDSEPYEIFAGKNNIIKNSVKSGVIIRKKRGYYIAKFDDGSELNPVNNYMDEEYMEIISRLSSGLLRTGADINFINSQLERIGSKQDQVHSFAKGMARALKKYIPDGSEGGECPECGEQMVRQEGCSTCVTCGFSRCL